MAGGVFFDHRFGDQPVFNNQGILIKSAGTGEFKIEAVLTNSGSITIQTGKINARDYIQTADGTLTLVVAGLVPGTEHGQLTTTNATLNGAIVASFDGFTPAAGDSLLAVTYVSRNGEFATVSSQGAAVSLMPAYGTTGLTLNVN